MKKIYFILLACLFTQLTSAQQIWFDGFEDGLGAWTTIDGDGDGLNWDIGSAPAINAATGTNCAISYSWTQVTGAVTPNNYLISPAIDLTATTGTILVDWKAYGQDQTWANEHYQVIAATEATQAAVDAGTVLYDGIVGSNNGAYQSYTGNLTDFAGQMIHIAFVHNDVTDQFALNIDDVEVYSSSTVDVGVTAVASPNHDDGCTLTSSENVTVSITNFGGADATGFDVSYSVNGGAMVTETVTETIAPAATYDYTFTASEDMSALAEYTIEASASIADDVDASNDASTLNTRSSDSQITVHVMSDGGGGALWSITDNSTNEVVFSRGSYQWNVEVFDDICVYSDRCYTFNYQGEMGAGAFLEILVDGVRVAGDTDGNGIAAAIDLFAIGGGCAANEASLTKTTFNTYQLLNSNADIKAELRNLGAASISEFTASYSVDGGSPIMQTFSGLDILQGATYEFTFDMPVDVAAMQKYDVDVNIMTVNGEMDDATNNSGEGDIIAMTEIPDRKFFFEEGTGTWCQFCPQGFVALEQLANDHGDNVIAVAIHNDDPMDFGTYDSEAQAIVSATGYPWGGANRTIEVFPAPGADLEAGYQSEQAKIAPARLNVTALMDFNTRELTVDVDAEIFAAVMSGEYRLNVILTEDGVTGTSAGYAQVNAYSGGGFGPLDGWENLANPVPASDMVYDHVARMLMGGLNGDAASAFSDVDNTATPSYQYTATIPADWDETKMHAVAILVNMTNDQVLNSATTTIEDIATVGVSNLFENNLARIFPNPFSNITNIELSLEGTENVTVEVMNAVGQRLAFRDYGELTGKMILPYDGSKLDNGIYFVHIRLNEKLITKKIMVAR